MKYLLTLLLATSILNTAQAQTDLLNEVTNDSRTIDSLYKIASAYEYSCTQRTAFEEKIEELMMYFDERTIFYSNIEESDPAFEKIGTTKSGFITYYTKTMGMPILNYKDKMKEYYVFCDEIKSNPALQNEEEIKEVISIYELYTNLANANLNYNSKIRGYEELLNPASGPIENVTCEAYVTVTRDCDTIDMEINMYLLYLDSANSRYNALPPRLQTLIVIGDIEEVEPDKLDDSSEERLRKAMQRKDNHEKRTTMYFNVFKGFRTELSHIEKTQQFLNQFKKPSTLKIREYLTARRAELGCS